MINDQKSFEILCHAVLEGKASEAELESLRQQLRCSAAARKAYAEQTQIHALLTWQQGRAAVPAPVVLAPMEFPATPNVIPFPLRRLLPLRRAMVAVAAVLVLLMGFSFWFGFGHSQNKISVADHKNLPVEKGVWVDILSLIHI